MSNHTSDGSRPSAADAALDRAWREASTEQPPADLDAAIVAAARRSVADRAVDSSSIAARVKSPTWWTRWQPLASAAGVAGLAFVLVQLLPREPNPAPSTPRSDVSQAAPESVEPRAPAQSELQPQLPPPPAPAQSQPQPQDRASAHRNAVPAPPVTGAPAAAAKAETTASEAAASDATAGDSRGSAVNVAPAVGAPPAANVARAVGAVPAPGEISADRRKAESAVAGRAASSPAAAPSLPARETREGDTAAVDVAAAVAKIVALHDSGDLAAAEDALRGFRATEPNADAYLPDSLRNWAQTVK